MLHNNTLYLLGGYRRGQKYPSDGWMAVLSGDMPGEKLKSLRTPSWRSKASDKQEAKTVTPAKRGQPPSGGGRRGRTEVATRRAASGRGKSNRSQASKPAAFLDEPSGYSFQAPLLLDTYCQHQQHTNTSNLHKAHNILESLRSKFDTRPRSLHARNRSESTEHVKIDSISNENASKTIE